MAKKKQKTICFIHYGIGWKDGINTVIKTLANQIKKQKPLLNICFIGGKIKEPILEDAFYKIIPELLPGNKLTKKILQKEALLIAKKVAKATKGMEVVVIENPFLGTYHLSAMMGFSIYAQEYKPAGTKVFFRIHDLYTDAPQYSKNLEKFCSSSKIKAIIKGKGVDGFLVVNRALKKELIRAGVSSQKIFYLPNGINASIFKERLTKKESDLIYKDLDIASKDKRKTKILFYPVRVVPRKNIEEAILLTYFIREVTGDNYILVVSGKVDKHDPLSRAYHQSLKKLARVAKFPIIFTKGTFPLERKYDSRGKIKKFSIGDLYQISQAVIMTSFREGFGYPFLECWFAGKVVIGHRTQNVIEDFEKSGLKFNWLYRHFFVEGKDLFKIKSEEYLEGAKEVINTLKNSELKKQTLKLNKRIIMNQVRILQYKNQQKQIIKSNLKSAKKTYEISKITKDFLKLISLK